MKPKDALVAVAEAETVSEMLRLPAYNGTTAAAAATARQTNRRETATCLRQRQSDTAS